MLSRNAEPAASRGRTKSNDSKSSSAYASRHQAAEQRRRTRINERLDRLRQVVPHAERANTASFLEEVITYIQGLQKRIAELEQAAAGGQPNTQPGTPPAVSGGHASEAGGASPASSEGCEGGVPLKKRRVVEGGSG
ncbi:hypothetical protein WJX75_004589 [Coccomyxa subellipsoidea]|uniref:BHLH domain-containing protein n=1 Tax=Coccomyxa subellipsoidea TaxID=248742 RepID=A0ABR2YTN7_9CHLO